MYIIKDMHRATKRGPQAWFEQEMTIEVKHGRLGGYSSLRR